MSTVTVRIRKGDEIREQEMKMELEVATFVFSGGNYSCDCYRGVFFGDYTGDEDVICGYGKYKVQVVHDGKIIYDEWGSCV